LKLTFLETPVFTAQVSELLSDEDYRRLQACLLINPLAGDVIAGTGGCRKLRWYSSGRREGKRGGTRVIYVHRRVAQQVVFLLIYDHREIDDLTPSQKKQLARVVKLMR
jgi:hypothetical protein